MRSRMKAFVNRMIDPNSGDRKIEAIIDLMLKRSYDKEHLYLIDERSGKLIYHVVGDRKSVTAPDEAIAYMRQNAVVSIHNHPKGVGVPSLADYTSALDESEYMGIVVGPTDGWVTMYQPEWHYIVQSGFTIDDVKTWITEVDAGLTAAWSQNMDVTAPFDYFGDWLDYAMEESFATYPFFKYSKLKR